MDECFAKRKDTRQTTMTVAAGKIVAPSLLLLLLLPSVAAAAAAAAADVIPAAEANGTKTFFSISKNKI